MPIDLNSSRQRAISRRSLLTLVIALLLAAACQTIPAVIWGGDPDAAAGDAVCAPPEAATRPNPPTEPVRGLDDPATTV